MPRKPKQPVPDYVLKAVASGVRPAVLNVQTSAWYVGQSDSEFNRQRHLQPDIFPKPTSTGKYSIKELDRYVEEDTRRRAEKKAE